MEDENYGITEPVYENIRNEEIRACYVLHGANGYIIIPVDPSRTPAFKLAELDGIINVEHSKWGCEWMVMSSITKTVGKDPVSEANNLFREQVAAVKKAHEAEMLAGEHERKDDEERENPA